MWILLTVKLPTEISPPKISIHWAGASAADVGKARQQKEKSNDTKKYESLTDMGDKYFNHATGFGYEPKEDGAVWIIFDSEPIKVWPHEYTTIKPENLELYLRGEDSDEYTMTHVPMYGRQPLFADPVTLKATKAMTQYPRFNQTLADAAMVDGENELQAFYTALGGYPLDLWFAINSVYASYYGLTERDMTPVYKDNEVYSQIKSGWQEEIGE